MKKEKTKKDKPKPGSGENLVLGYARITAAKGKILDYAVKHKGIPISVAEKLAKGKAVMPILSKIRTRGKLWKAWDFFPSKKKEDFWAFTKKGKLPKAA